MLLKEIIESYVPCDEQEEKDKEQMLTFINSFDDKNMKIFLLKHFPLQNTSLKIL